VPPPGVAVREERVKSRRGRSSGACAWDAVLSRSHIGYMRYPDLVSTLLVPRFK